MTQHDKQLLLKDLCARLPYGVKVAFQVGNNTPDVRIFTGEDYDCLKGYHYIDEFTKCTFNPYLRPMHSMTEEEAQEYYDLCYQDNDDIWGKCLFIAITDFCNQHHLDYRGLIEKGLAIEAPEGMYK